jgi:hypothetical protein
MRTLLIKVSSKGREALLGEQGKSAAIGSGMPVVEGRVILVSLDEQYGERGLPMDDGKDKKRSYLEPCLEQRCHFTPFVCSTNRLLGREAARSK